jgi:beta-galactosidase/evolved beta-galactosidase subunit alpha
LAWAQFPVPVKAVQGWPVPQLPSAPLQIKETGREIVLSGPSFELALDRLHARISEWRADGLELLTSGPRLNFWRAPTDNDAGVANKWRDAGIHTLQHRIESVTCKRIDAQAAKIVASVRIAPPVYSRVVEAEYVYTVHGDGRVSIEVCGETKGEWPDVLPRIGLQFGIPAWFDSAEWFGLGPEETYVDSLQAGKLGVWSAEVDDLYTPYIMPQENGNRSGARWVALTNDRGDGLLALGLPTINFSVHRFTPEDFAAAKHTHELTPREDLTVNLDYRHNGLGSASCGPGPLEQYWLRPGPFSFAVRLAPLQAEAGSPAALARLLRELE